MHSTPSLKLAAPDRDHRPATKETLEDKSPRCDTGRESSRNPPASNTRAPKKIQRLLPFQKVSRPLSGNNTLHNEANKVGGNNTLPNEATKDRTLSETDRKRMGPSPSVRHQRKSRKTPSRQAGVFRKIPRPRRKR